MCARICLTTLTLLIGAAVAAAQSTVIRVAVGGTGDGSTWGNAANLHAALGAGGSNKELWLKEGIYTPHASDPSVFFNLSSGTFALYGGFDGTEDTREGRDPANDVTVLSGNISVFDQSYTILWEYDHGSGAIVIDGITFTGGRADGTNTPQRYEVGGAIYIAGSGTGDITINDCIFEGNYADLDGGAVYIQNQNSTITVTNCLFDDNEATSGGGLAVHGCGELIVGGENAGCTFENNSASSAAAAMIVGGTTATISHSTFTGNEAVGTTASGGAIWANMCGSNSLTFTVSDCTFSYNKANDTGGGNGYGGAVYVKGYTGGGAFTNTDFIENQASQHGGAVFLYSVDHMSQQCYTGPFTFSGCWFDNNRCDLNDYASDEDAGRGGAIWSRNVDVACTNTDFDDNVAPEGGGAIWFVARVLDGDDDAELTLTGCKFRRNIMDPSDEQLYPSGPADTDVIGGGAVLLDGVPGVSSDPDLVATITNCDFIENEAHRGGGIYSFSGTDVHVTNCRFVANEAAAAGGGMCIANEEEIETAQVRICKSHFVSNKGQKGGAIHNHESAITYMVNCYLAGNFSTQEGGGVFNSHHTGGGTMVPELHMHNCIIAGNEAYNATDSKDMGGGVFNGLDYDGEDFDNDTGITDLRHCTIIANHAGHYGGVVDGSKNSRLKFYNSISRDNTDLDGGTSTFKEQLFHIEEDGAGYVDDDVDTFLAQGTLPSPYFDDPMLTWSSGDPVFLEDGTTTLTWDSSVFDPPTGLVTFTVDDAAPAEVGMLFKPDPGNSTFVLVIQAVDTGADEITCWGYWPDENPWPTISGELYDLHIDSSGVADDLGSAARIASITNGGCGDRCDLNNNSTTDEPLPYDLDAETPNARNQASAPDAGVYEIPD